MSVHEVREGVWRIQIYSRRRSDVTRLKVRETLYGDKRQAEAREAELETQAAWPFRDSAQQRSSHTAVDVRGSRR